MLVDVVQMWTIYSRALLRKQQLKSTKEIPGQAVTGDPSQSCVLRGAAPAQARQQRARKPATTLLEFPGFVRSCSGFCLYKGVRETVAVPGTVQYLPSSGSPHSRLWSAQRRAGQGSRLQMLR